MTIMSCGNMNLFDVNGDGDLRDNFGDVPLKRGDVDVLSHGASHCAYYKGLRW